MTINLLDGRTVESADINLDRSTYHVYHGTEDITRNMRQNDKVAVFFNFDRERDNNRASDESRLAQGLPTINPGSTSVLYNFASQIVTDPLSAPLDYADQKITGRLAASSTVRIVVVLALFGAVAYFWPVIKPIIKRFTK